MKKWLKYGLIGAAIGFAVRFIMIFLSILLGILAYARGWQGGFINNLLIYPAFPFISYCSSLEVGPSLYCIHGFAILNFVLIGAIIGLIVSKLKKAPENH